MEIHQASERVRASFKEKHKSELIKVLQLPVFPTLLSEAANVCLQ